MEVFQIQLPQTLGHLDEPEECKSLKLSEARNVDKFEIKKNVSEPMVAIKHSLKLTAMHDMPDPPTLLFIDSSFVSKSKK